jgi:tRNA threonylcarbamoyladenosine biosynthesis protein TsaE
MLTIHSGSPADTLHFGRVLAAVLQAGDVICLTGNLGAGKTLLAKGIADGLGIRDEVTSPTFTMLQVYEARVPVYHFDLYRLEQAEELADIGFDEFTASQGISIIEWADKFPDSMPDGYLWVEIHNGSDIADRLIRVEPRGSRYDNLCKELKNFADPRFGNSHPGI